MPLPPQFFLGLIPPFRPPAPVSGNYASFYASDQANKRHAAGLAQQADQAGQRRRHEMQKMRMEEQFLRERNAKKRIQELEEMRRTGTPAQANYAEEMLKQHYGFRRPQGGAVPLQPGGVAAARRFQPEIERPQPPAEMTPQMYQDIGLNEAAQKTQVEQIDETAFQDEPAPPGVPEEQWEAGRAGRLQKWKQEQATLRSEPEQPPQMEPTEQLRGTMRGAAKDAARQAQQQPERQPQRQDADITTPQGRQAVRDIRKIPEGRSVLLGPGGRPSVANPQAYAMARAARAGETVKRYLQAFADNPKFSGLIPNTVALARDFAFDNPELTPDEAAQKALKEMRFPIVEEGKDIRNRRTAEAMAQRQAGLSPSEELGYEKYRDQKVARVAEKNDLKGILEIQRNANKLQEMADNPNSLAQQAARGEITKMVFDSRLNQKEVDIMASAKGHWNRIEEILRRWDPRDENAGQLAKAYQESMMDLARLLKKAARKEQLRIAQEAKAELESSGTLRRIYGDDVGEYGAAVIMGQGYNLPAPGRPMAAGRTETTRASVRTSETKTKPEGDLTEGDKEALELLEELEE